MGKGNMWVWGGGGSSSRQCVQCNSMREGDGRRGREGRRGGGDRIKGRREGGGEEGGRKGEGGEGEEGEGEGGKRRGNVHVHVHVYRYLFYQPGVTGLMTNFYFLHTTNHSAYTYVYNVEARWRGVHTPQPLCMYTSYICTCTCVLYFSTQLMLSYTHTWRYVFLSLLQRPHSLWSRAVVPVECRASSSQGQRLPLLLRLHYHLVPEQLILCLL